jgi:hypothetical protein
MRIHHLYEDEYGESHFKDLDVEWVGESHGSKLSAWYPASGLRFRQTPEDHDREFHPGPRRQFIINLDAGARITASDGESRIIGPGEIMLVEDLTGKGHLAQAVNGQVRNTVSIALE